MMQQTEVADVMVPRALVASPDTLGGDQVGAYLRGSAVVHNNRLKLHPPKGGAARIVLPAPVEAHCHLDKCHTIHRLENVGGNLIEAIAKQAEDKVHWTEADVRERAMRGLAEASAAGCRLLRTHVDWGYNANAPLAWHVLSDLRPGDIDLQLSALTGIDQMADPTFAQTVAKAVKASGGVLGSYVRGQPELKAGIRQCFEQAGAHGLMLDFHVDEDLGDFNGLEVIADMALETRFEGPVLCGHAVSLIDREPDDFARISEKLARANITICALPLTNLYLQGRASGTPDRRGITRLLELAECGVQTAVGSDNVADAFCPVGRHDPREALHVGILTAHLDPPLENWLPLITTHAATALGVDDWQVDTLPPHQLVCADSQNLTDIIAGRVPLEPFEEVFS